jgi:DNA-binding transcriptional regulator YiaG
VDFATRFKAAREKLGLTQVKMSLKCRVSHATIQNWEAGKKGPVGYRRERIEALLRKIESQDR